MAPSHHIVMFPIRSHPYFVDGFEIHSVKSLSAHQYQSHFSILLLTSANFTGAVVGYKLTCLSKEIPRLTVTLWQANIMENHHFTRKTHYK